MTYLDAQEPGCHKENDIIRVMITPAEKDLGDFTVRRVLPAAMAQQVGPFVFFDHMGPAVFPPGKGINVRPHPHIGLSTVTYLFEGEILHRDSLGFTQPIQPGAVNLMTAGHGIVHSERTSDALLAAGQTLHGLQVWMALPDDQQDIEPAFVHYPADQLPVIDTESTRATVVIGTYEGETSGVRVLPETLYVDIQTSDDALIPIPGNIAERAVYLVEGDASISGCRIPAGSMAIIETGAAAEVSASAGSRFIIVGGEKMTPRHLWWNFVHTSRDMIENAKQRWQDKRFGSVPEDEEFIPLPEK